MPLLRRDFLKRSVAASCAALAAGSIAPAADNARPLNILFYGGSLPSVETDLSKKVKLVVLKAGQDSKKQGNVEDNVVGLEQLKDAHLWIGSGNKRNLPSKTALQHFHDYLEAGRPFVGYRAASHIFQNFLEVDQLVWGAKYGGHHLMHKDPELIVEYGDKAKEHPILAGLTPPAPSSGSYYYRERVDDVQVLLFSGLKGDMQPHTWTRTIAKTGNRVFYTRYDSKHIAKDEVCREIFLRGITWALGGDLSRFAKA
jgi:hypothetical protein